MRACTAPGERPRIDVVADSHARARAFPPPAKSAPRAPSPVSRGSFFQGAGRRRRHHAVPLDGDRRAAAARSEAPADGGDHRHSEEPRPRVPVHHPGHRQHPPQAAGDPGPQAPGAACAAPSPPQAPPPVTAGGALPYRADDAGDRHSKSYEISDHPAGLPPRLRRHRPANSPQPPVAVSTANAHRTCRRGSASRLER
jgi:hypothetical protein